MRDLEEKKKYELAVLLDNETAEAAVDQVLSGSKEGGIEIINKGPSRLINLAYPIKKHSSAIFLAYQFFADPDNIANIKEALRFQPNVLRSMLVSLPKEKSSQAGGQKQAEKEVKTSVAPEPRPSVGIATNELLAKTLEELESKD